MPRTYWLLCVIQGNADNANRKEPNNLKDEDEAKLEDQILSCYLSPYLSNFLPNGVDTAPSRHNHLAARFPEKTRH